MITLNPLTHLFDSLGKCSAPVKHTGGCFRGEVSDRKRDAKKRITFFFTRVKEVAATTHGRGVKGRKPLPGMSFKTHAHGDIRRCGVLF